MLTAGGERKDQGDRVLAADVTLPAGRSHRRSSSSASSRSPSPGSASSTSCAGRRCWATASGCGSSSSSCSRCRGRSSTWPIGRVPAPVDGGARRRGRRRAAAGGAAAPLYALYAPATTPRPRRRRGRGGQRPRRPAKPPAAAVAIAGLTKVYGKAHALDGVDLVVPEGSVFGFLGPNGAGKTTTLRILAGLARPTDGIRDRLRPRRHARRRRRPRPDRLPAGRARLLQVDDGHRVPGALGPALRPARRRAPRAHRDAARARRPRRRDHQGSAATRAA